MLRTVALSLAAVHITLGDSCSHIKAQGTCKQTTGCKWQKKLAVCFEKELGPPADSPEPTLPPSHPPTSPPTEPPTAPPTEPPTDAPTDQPSAMPTEPPTLPPTEVVDPVDPTSAPVDPTECNDILAKSTCNKTPTCVYQNLNQACVSCPSIESKNTCTGVEGCMWRAKQCKIDDTEKHPNDDICSVNTSKRHCRRMSGCEWNRNGKCRGHQGCSAQKNNVDCRGAHKCTWQPNQNKCVDEDEP